MQGPALTSNARKTSNVKGQTLRLLALGLLAAFAWALAQPVHAATPPTASLVMDAHSGKILYSRNADEYRYPASLTKVMTLYLLFEGLEAKKFTLKSRITMTPRGAGMPPSKLGLRAGQTISVEDAILGVLMHILLPQALIHGPR